MMSDIVPEEHPPKPVDLDIILTNDAAVNTEESRKDPPLQEEKQNEQPGEKAATAPRNNSNGQASRVFIPESTRLLLHNAVDGLPIGKKDKGTQTLPVNIEARKGNRKRRTRDETRRKDLPENFQVAYQAIAEAHDKKYLAKQKLIQARKALAEAEKIYHNAQSADKLINDTHGPLVLQDSGDEWNMNYQQLKEYMEKNGPDSEPSEDGDVNESLLVKWIRIQRSLYRTEDLENYKITALERINFMWNKSDVNIANLLAFKQKHGHTRVPAFYKENVTLGNWVRKLRMHHRNGAVNDKVPKEIVDKLNSIGFVWDVYEDHFNTMFEELMKYKKIHGHCHVDKNDTTNPELVDFVREMRAAYLRFQKPRRKLTRDILTGERIKKLEAEGFQWNLDGVKWYKKYLALVRFQKKFGSCNVPRSFDLELYNFVNIQRRDYRIRLEHPNKGITDKRMQLLSELGFIFVVQNGKGRPVKKSAAHDVTIEVPFEHNHQMN